MATPSEHGSPSGLRHEFEAASTVATQQPFRSKTLGFMLIVISPIASIILFYILWEYVDDYRFLVLGGVLLYGLTYWGIDTGRKMRTVDGWDLLRRDPRRPVVYLRPFQEDQRLRYSGPVGKRVGGEDVNRPGGTPATREPELARQLSRVGPCIAVGKPGDKLPPLGFSRIYVSDNRWQQEVTRLLRQASAVVIQPDASPGTLWELDAVARDVDFRKMLLVVPHPLLRPLGYERVREITAQALSVLLPAPGECGACDAFMFDERRQPLPLSLKSASALNSFVQQVVQLNRASGGVR